MAELVYTLVGDGPGDRRLMHPINWLLAERFSGEFRGQWADTRAFVRIREGLRPRLETALEMFPCDVLVVHRDAEAADYRRREREIDDALAGLDVRRPVRLVPVRMQEAWFLFDEPAIRRAAGKPSGQRKLGMPRLDRIESVADPKALLHGLLREASEASGRKLQRLDVNGAVSRVAELIDDFGPLRRLAAFRRFEAELMQAVNG